jgi:predicted DNA-binding antitoxin AbrB/MazE fold protein
MVVEAIYEMGMLRLLQPLTLAEGSKVEVSIVPSKLLSEEKTPLEILQAIADLPLEGNVDSLSNRNHDQILYS